MAEEEPYRLAATVTAEQSALLSLPIGGAAEVLPLVQGDALTITALGTSYCEAVSGDVSGYVSTGGLRGLGASTVPMIISVLGVCGIRILWIYTIFQIPQFHTQECLYLSYIISWTITFVAQTIAFILIYKKQKRLDWQLSSI